MVGTGEDQVGGLLPPAPATVEPRVRRTVERPVPLEAEEGSAEPAVVIEVAVGRERPLLPMAEHEHDLLGPVAAGSEASDTVLQGHPRRYDPGL